MVMFTVFKLSKYLRCQRSLLQLAACRQLSVSVCNFSEAGAGSSEHWTSDEDVHDQHKDSFRQDYDQLYQGHIPTTFFQKALLSVGSAAMAITNPWRGDMIATLGETTGYPGLLWTKRIMESHPVGRQILRERPVINTGTVNLEYLDSLPDGTFGKEYAIWLKVNRANPDERLPVHFVDDVDLAYVMRRYRELHDLVHCVLGQPTNMLGEVTVKMFEGIQTGLFMCVSGGLLGAVRLGPKHLEMYRNTHFAWAVRNALRSQNMMTVYFEKHWQQPIEGFRAELGLETPPYTPPRRNFDK
jgi:ubiquinone biosynthesis protein COQ4